MKLNGPGGISRRTLLRDGATTVLGLGGLGMGLALAVFSSETTVHGQRRKKLRFITISHSVNTAVYAPHLVAQELGFFTDSGLNANLIVPGGGARVAQMLGGRQVGFAQGDTSHPLKISEGGRATAMIYGIDTRCSYANILVRKALYDAGLTTVEKLATMKRPDGERLTIAATRIGSGTWTYGNFILSQHRANGRPVNEQVNWVGGGGTTTMLGGLKSGRFDAIMAVPIWMTRAIGDGYGAALFDTTTKPDWDRVFGADIPTTVGYALKGTLHDEAALTQGYVTAIYKAMGWLKGRNPSEVYDKIGRKYMGTLGRRQITDELKYYQAIFNYGLEISPTEFEAGKRVWVPRATRKNWTYEEVVDMRFVNNATTI